MNVDPSAVLVALPEAARALAAAIKPITIVEDGSGKRRPWGSAFVLSRGEQRIIVTAHHVVEGPQVKYMGLSSAGSIQWPRHYSVLDRVTAELPVADVAYAIASMKPDAEPDLFTAIPLAQVLPDSRLAPGASLLAAGFPGSLGKLRDAQARLRNELLYAVGSAVPADAYTALGLDQRVHLAMTYDRMACRSVSGKQVVGPLPKGMSGGVLFLLTIETRDNEEKFLVSRVVGILEAYHQDPANVMVATRIECLLDGLDIVRDGVPKRYRRRDV